ncbi:MAG TPA: acetylglutamate kinase, partial [Aquella sp.]|nr:acetylglutamate kinase [Aquella sp.]
KKEGFSVVIVHGGGPDITQLCNKLNIESEFVNGQRVTNRDILDATQMALLGKINCNLVYKLNLAKVDAIGLSGHDVNLINADFENQQELGFVGKINKINCNFLMKLLSLGITPVIAPLGVDTSLDCEEYNGNTYNINADLVAAEIAKALKAHKLILLSDIDGFYGDIIILIA